MSGFFNSFYFYMMCVGLVALLLQYILIKIFLGPKAIEKILRESIKEVYNEQQKNKD